jgi:hypothetical protein
VDVALDDGRVPHNFRPCVLLAVLMQERAGDFQLAPLLPNNQEIVKMNE